MGSRGETLHIEADLGDDPLARLDQLPHPFLGGPMGQRTRCRVELGVELVQVPAQAIDHPCPLRDQVLTTSQDQLDLPGPLIGERGRQIVFPRQRPRYGQSIDRIGLPTSARGGALA